MCPPGQVSTGGRRGWLGEFLGAGKVAQKVDQAWEKGRTGHSNVGQILTPSHVPTGVLKGASICACDFMGAAPSSSIGVKGKSLNKITLLQVVFQPSPTSC